MGEQQSYYLENEEYADFLEGWDAGFYAKYADTLCPDEPGGKGGSAGGSLPGNTLFERMANLSRGTSSSDGDADDEDDDGDVEDIIANQKRFLEEFYYYHQQIRGLPLSLQIGRMDFDEGREWFYDTSLDAVRLSDFIQFRRFEIRHGWMIVGSANNQGAVQP